MAETASISKLTYVTIAQAVAFDKEKPETWTSSPVLNTILYWMNTLHPVNLKIVGERLGVSNADLNGAVKCATGMHFAEFLRLWRLAMFAKIKSENPKIATDELAHRLGFYNHTSMWFFLKREHQKVRHRRSQEELRRIGEEVHEYVMKYIVGRQNGES